MEAILMTTIKTYLTQDHRECDKLFSDLENHVAKKEWNEAKALFEPFEKAMIRHFEIEEQVIFPAFEQKTGFVGGPTRVMTMEHQQMRGVIEGMQGALKEQDRNRFLGLSETLMILLQQHNMKEEQMLYNMIDMHLQEENDNLMKEVVSR